MDQEYSPTDDDELKYTQMFGSRFHYSFEDPDSSAIKAITLRSHRCPTVGEFFEYEGMTYIVKVVHNKVVEESSMQSRYGCNGILVTNIICVVFDE